MTTASGWRTSIPVAGIAPGHGAKRRHDHALDDGNDSPDTAQRLAKRFHLLDIDNNGRLWVDPDTTSSSSSSRDRPRRRSPTPNETMHVDDTKDRVYIHNLDEELADTSDDDSASRLVFLPDIERRLNRLPLRALLGGSNDGEGDAAPSANTDVVLYGVPRALSVPEDRDGVRRAILESRARARHALEGESRSESAEAEAGGDGDGDAMELG